MSALITRLDAIDAAVRRSRLEFSLDDIVRVADVLREDEPRLVARLDQAVSVIRDVHRDETTEREMASFKVEPAAGLPVQANNNGKPQ